MDMKNVLFSPDYHGHQPLARVFWIYGVLFSHLYFAVILMAHHVVSTPLMGLLLVGFVVYTAGILRLVWINAENTQRHEYIPVARYLTVAWAINAVLVSGFLWVDHYVYMMQ